MNLQEQGFRFILRRSGARVDGYWEHPATIRPGGFDATDLDDDALASAIYDLQDGHDPKQPPEGRLRLGLEAAQESGRFEP